MRRLTHMLIVLLLGSALAAAPLLAQDAETEIEVYKKWIGASGEEADVEAHLSCEGRQAYPRRWINRDEPAIWRLADVPDEGMFCTVLEVERETFVADIEDCRDLLVLPGEGAECTLVNTKVVKRIEMLNRYGLVIMIAVMLGAGLAAVRRYGHVQRDLDH